MFLFAKRTAENQGLTAIDQKTKISVDCQRNNEIMTTVSK